MSEMVERVADALERWAFESGGGGVERAKSLSLARAAIAAMREPTAEMVQAGRHVSHGDDGWVGAEAAAEVWRDMVDAALKAAPT